MRHPVLLALLSLGFFVAGLVFLIGAVQVGIPLLTLCFLAVAILLVLFAGRLLYEAFTTK